MKTLIFALLLLFNSNGFAQSIDPAIQAAFYSKLFPMIGITSETPITIIVDDELKPSAEYLSEELKQYNYQAAVSESITETAQSVVIVVENTSNKIFNLTKGDVKLIISTNQNDVLFHRASFCLIKKDGKLKLMASKKVIT